MITVPLAQPASASTGAPFSSIQSPFTDTLFASTSDSFYGGVAFAPNGDVWVDDCSVSGSPLHRFAQASTYAQNGATLASETTASSNAGCGLTNNPDGFLYSNTSGGVVQIDASTGAPTGKVFGAAGDALGIASDPQTSNLVYVGSDGTILTASPGGSSSTFSAVTTGSFIDGIAFDPTGKYLFASNRTLNTVTILNRSGGLVQNSQAIPGAPDGIAFHSTSPQFVITNNNDGTMTRLDFANGDYTQTPVASTFASGGYRGDLAQVGADGCIYLTQDGTTFPDGTTSSADSVVKVCPGFAPPPGVSGGGVGRYVALGDSYSSGEGAINIEGDPSFDPSTNVPKVDECHRSLNAYPNLLSTEPQVNAIPSGFVFAACSGARVANFVKELPGDGGWNEGPQLDAIAFPGSTDSGTGLITLSVGGNDAGFVPDLKACIHGFGRGQSGCAAQVSNRLANGLKLLTHGGRVAYHIKDMDNWRFCPSCRLSAPNVVDVPSLSALYEEIHSRAPNAKILVLGYPELFPANAPTACVVGTFVNDFGRHLKYALDPPEMNRLDQAEKSLNATISAQVEIAKDDGVNIDFVPSYAAFQGHGPCDTTPPNSVWLNGLMWQGSFIGDTSTYSFHPTQAGQADFERLLLPNV